MPQLSKLQIRAKVLSVISEIKSIPSFNEEVLISFYEELSQIEDRKTLFDVFLKEFIKLNETQYTFSSVLLKELVSSEYIIEKVMDVLRTSTLSDELKYKLVQLLRIVGGGCDFSELPQYFDNPEEVLDKETKRLLDSAYFNPESMLDFLDFVSAVSPHDRNLLLQSLRADYQGDVLANIVYPILYSDFEDDFVLEAIDILSESKSSIAIAPFEFLLKVSNNPAIVNACKVGLKKLKLSGAKAELAVDYFNNMISSSIPAEFFTTIPDGHGNQALLISRCSENGAYLLAAVVISDIHGIIDCFGFYNIIQEEVIKIIGKFYKTEGKYKVSPEYIKSRINEAVEITQKNKGRFPYEFVCWAPLIYDIHPLGVSLKDYVYNNCKVQLCSKDKILDILTKDYTLRWFITPSENKHIKSLVEYIYSSNKFDIDDVNTRVRDAVDIVFNNEISNIWLNRVYNLIYLLRTNKHTKEADIFYTMINNQDYLTLFKQIIIQRSIFNYFVAQKENLKDAALSANIFRKKNSEESKFDGKKLDKVLEKLGKNWLDG